MPEVFQAPECPKLDALLSKLSWQQRLRCWEWWSEESPLSTFRQKCALVLSPFLCPLVCCAQAAGHGWYLSHPGLRHILRPRLSPPATCLVTSLTALTVTAAASSWHVANSLMLNIDATYPDPQHTAFDFRDMAAVRQQIAIGLFGFPVSTLLLSPLLCTAPVAPQAQRRSSVRKRVFTPLLVYMRTLRFWLLTLLLVFASLSTVHLVLNTQQTILDSLESTIDDELVPLIQKHVL